MNKIDTPAVTLELKGGKLLATHKKTGAVVPISLEVLERWLIRKLRELF